MQETYHCFIINNMIIVSFVAVWVILCIILAILYGIRIEQVAKYRMNLLKNDIDQYYKLPSFDSMCDKWWISVDHFSKRERMLRKLGGEK